MNKNGTTCTCSDDAIGCPVHDFGFSTTAERIEELTGMRSVPNTPAGAALAIKGTVHQGSAALRPAKPKTEPKVVLRVSPRDFLISSLHLIPAQPTPEQWITIKTALAELLDSTRAAAGG